VGTVLTCTASTYLTYFENGDNIKNIIKCDSQFKEGGYCKQGECYFKCSSYKKAAEELRIYMSASNMVTSNGDIILGL
jgi:hypothetical protein